MGKYNRKDNGLTVDLSKVDMKEDLAEGLSEGLNTERDVSKELNEELINVSEEQETVVVSDIVPKIPEGWGDIDTTSDANETSNTSSEVKVTNLEGVKTATPPKVSIVSPELEAYLNTLPTKSAKIRHMNSLGFRRAQIASHLGIIYQHVRNVLTQEVRRPRGSEGQQTTAVQSVQQMVTSQHVVPEEMAIDETAYEPQMRIYG